MKKTEKKALAGKIIALVGSCLITGMAAASVDSTTSYTYNGLGLVATIDGPRIDVSDITSFGYDAQGNRTSITNALGQITHITAHDASGRPLTIMDSNGVTTQLSYDARGRLLNRTTAGQTTSMQYDGVGNITRITQPDNSYINYEYDAAHRLIGISDILGNRIQYTLDNAGNRTQEEVYDPSNTLKRSHSNVFDELSRMLQDIGAAGQTSSFSYDPNGNQTGRTDPNQNSSTQAFDALNRLTQITDALQGNTIYSYDAQDNLTSVTDPRGNTTTYTYDALGNLLSQQSPDTGTTTYTYDEAGNRLSSTDARSITANYSYDALNRITGTQYPADSSQNISYSYDETDVTNGIGRLTRIVDPSGTSRYHYDTHGNTTKVVTTLGGQTHTTQYAYDGANNLIRITYPSGRIVDYTDLNNDNRIDQVTLNDQGTIMVLADNIEYLPFGPRSDMQFGNGLSQTRVYNLDYSLENQSMPVGDPDSDGDGIADSSDNCQFASNADQMDSGGLNTTVPDGIGDACQCGDVNHSGIVDNTDAIIIQRYVHSMPPGVDLDKCNVNSGNTCDNTDAIIIQRAVHGLPPGLTQSCVAAVGNSSAAETGTWYYGLDAAGNITSRGSDPDPQNASHTYNYDELHRLIDEINPEHTDSYSYDANGNRTALTRDGADTDYLIFANNNQIDQVGSDPRTYDAAGNTTSDHNGTRTFIYNQAGRLSQIQENGQSIVSYSYNALGQRAIKSAQSGSTYYLYNLTGQILGEYDAAGQTIKEYVHLAGEPIAQLETSNIIYLHTDHLGTPRRASNEAGQVVWQWDSEAFGNELPHSSDGTTVNLRFPGQYYDEETGLYYNYFRYYDPNTGRYITSDPIGLEGGLNTYLYANANSLRYIDPKGLTSLIGCANPANAAVCIEAGIIAGSRASPIVVPKPEEKCEDEKCPPCDPYPVGTIGYQGPEVHQRGKYAGKSHYHIFVVNQRKSDCKCFWNYASKKEFGHQYFGEVGAGWIDLNGSSRPPNYPR